MSEDREFCSATTVEIVVNLAVISFNSGQVPFAKFQERLEVTVSPPTRQDLSDKDHHRVSASVMEVEAQVKRRWQAQHLDRWHWRSSKWLRRERPMALGGLVVTGQAGHTLEVEPPPPPPPNIFLAGFFKSHCLLKGFTNCVCVCVCVYACV